MWTTKPRFEAPGFYACPTGILSAYGLIDRQRTDEVYREAYDRARALHQPPITERLAPSVN